jgi:hypothetical protein
MLPISSRLVKQFFGERAISRRADAPDCQRLPKPGTSSAKNRVTRLQELSRSATKASEEVLIVGRGNGFIGGAPAAANREPALMNVGQGRVSTLQAYQGSRVLNAANMNFNCMGDQVLCTDPVSGKVAWSLKLETLEGPIRLTLLMPRRRDKSAFLAAHLVAIPERPDCDSRGVCMRPSIANITARRCG